VILNLGADFSLPQEEWKELTDRIEGVITKQIPLFPVPKHIESTAQKYAREIIRCHGKTTGAKDPESPKVKEPSGPKVEESNSSKAEESSFSKTEESSCPWPEADYQTVDINSLENEEIRSVG
jgi:hypothetical protein